MDTWQPYLFEDEDLPEPAPESELPVMKLLPTPTVSLATAGPVDPDRYLRRGKYKGKNPFSDLDDAIATLEQGATLPS